MQGQARMRAVGRGMVVFGLGIALAGCAFPKRDYTYLPDASVIQVQMKDGQWVATPPNCNKFYPEYPRDKFDSRPQAAFGCATYTNLANSVARPQDLAVPAAYSGQMGDTAGSAVTRYREGKITPLRDTTSTSKTGGN